MSKDNSILKPVQTPSQAGMPAWMDRMWEAARNTLTNDKIQSIVAKQIEKAEAGDEKALRFVFETVMGGSAFKGATFVQKNETHEHKHSHYHEADEGTSAGDGLTPHQFERNRWRHAARVSANGLGLNDDD